MKLTQRGRRARVELQPRLRVVRSGEIALGPGKTELLGYISDTGSIREAASRMGMSYMRAWTLIRTMNACFREPLVVATRGGRKRGGAGITATGRRALHLYRRTEAQSRVAAKEAWRQLQELLKG